MPELQPLVRALPKIPLGVSDWNKLADNHKNYVVVDKTAKLAELAQNDTVFIARPRRMGKTTLCSMLYELFAHGKESFKGQAVYDLWPETDVYPVIRLSFNVFSGDDVSKFEESLKDALLNAFSQAGFPEVESFQKNLTLTGFLGKFGRIALQHKLVIIIDEWDYPLFRCLHDEDRLNVVKSVLRDFYAWLRALPNVHFMLLTGIMRYRETSLFSGQDIQDLSMVPYFADLLGYTQD